MFYNFIMFYLKSFFFLKLHITNNFLKYVALERKVYIKLGHVKSKRTRAKNYNTYFWQKNIKQKVVSNNVV